MKSELMAYEYCQETINIKNNVEKGYMVMCARLYKIKDEMLYEANYGSWELFLDELKLNKRKADTMIKIYEVFVKQLGISEEMVALAGGWSIAETLLPLATSKEEAEEALLFASGSLRKDVRMYVNDKLGKTPEGICTHGNTYTVNICRDCGERHQVFDELNETI